MKEPNPSDVDRIDAANPQNRRRMSPALIGLIALAAFVAVFILQNRDRIELDFLVVEVRARTWTAMAISIVLGIVLDRLFLRWWRKRREQRNAR